MKLSLDHLFLALACCYGLSAQANPIGAQIVNGTANINQNGNLLTITNSPNAIINWQGFSIGSGETTNFIQQSVNSSILNRVIGADPSALLGTMTSNGKVFLINPAGIMVGQGARIDVGGLVASTLNLSNANFLAGKLNFDATPNAGTIQNNGSITSPEGGTVYLVAPQVENYGIINTPKGETILAAGNTVQLMDTGTPGVTVQVTGADNNATNLGQILADSGRIGMVGALVKNSGTISANSIVSQGGKIFLKATNRTEASGTITANGTTGGTIEVLGNEAGVMDGATVSANGAQGGGTVLVGGDFQGKNPDVQNALVTYVAPTASISADALQNGNGGKVIVWADDTTRAYGNISARGGSNVGNGGFVEVSGHNYLDFQGYVDTRAPQGLAGSLLLDPSDITIDNSTDNLNSGTLGGGYFQNATGPAVLTWNTINTQTGSLEIRTSGSGGTGLININASGAITGPSTLTLVANSNINIYNGVSISGGSSNINMVAGWNNSGWAVASGTGTITFNNGSSLSTTGNLYLAAGSDITEANATISANNLEILSYGNVSLNASNQVNTIAANATGTFTFGNAATGGLTIGTGAGFSTQGVTAGGAVSIGQNTAGGITVNQNVTSTGGLTKIEIPSGTGTLTVSGGTTVSGNGDQVDTFGGAIMLNGNITDNNASGIHVGGAAPGSITGTGIISTSGLLTTSSLGGTNLSGANTVGSLNASNTTSGNIAFTNNAAFTASGVANTAAGGSISLTDTAANTMLTNPTNPISTSNGTITLTADKMNLAVSTGTINAGTGSVILQSYTTANAIDLGSTVDTTASTLELSQAELGTVTTSGALRIGSTTSGTLNVSAAIAPANAGVLSLVSGGAITQASAGTITTTNLAINAGGNVALSTATNPVSYLAATVSGGTGHNFSFKSSGALEIGTNVAGLTGITMAGFTNPYGVISLISGGALTQDTGAMLGGSSVYATGTSVTLSNANPTGVISGSTTSGDFVYHSANPIAVTTVNGVNGITVQNATNVILTADSNNINLSQPINGGSGTFYLNAVNGGFVNNVGTGAMITSGRWLVYANSPTNVTKNGLTSNFRHYNATYANYASPGETGDGFIYASTPGTLSVNTTLSSGTASNTVGSSPTAIYSYTLSGAFDKEDISGTPTFTPVITSATSTGSYNVAYASGLTSVSSFSGNTAANPSAILSLPAPASPTQSMQLLQPIPA